MVQALLRIENVLLCERYPLRLLLPDLFPSEEFLETLVLLQFLKDKAEVPQRLVDLLVSLVLADLFALFLKEAHEAGVRRDREQKLFLENLEVPEQPAEVERVHFLIQKFQEIRVLDLLVKQLHELTHPINPLLVRQEIEFAQQLFVLGHLHQEIHHIHLDYFLHRLLRLYLFDNLLVVFTQFQLQVFYDLF